MEADVQVAQLEQALLQQAETLARVRSRMDRRFGRLPSRTVPARFSPGWLALAVVTAILTPQGALAQPRPFTVHDLIAMDRLSEPVPSPDGAEIMTARKQVSNAGGYRKTEWTLIEGETIYVIGEHVTLGGPNAVLDTKADLSTLLAEWKADKAGLLARFDADRDGEILQPGGMGTRARPQRMKSTGPTSTSA